MKTVYKDMVLHLQSAEHLDAYAHQCNCFARMGRGIAPLLAAVVPGLREADYASGEGNRSKMGTFTYANAKSGARVYNVYGQYHWQKYQVVPGRNTDYGALRKGMARVMEDMVANRLKTLGIPLIGCGLAGGDWKIVEQFIKELEADFGIEVTLFIKK
ncbi:phosphatase [Vibrio phage phi 3]|uniref:Macro domain-containing protein n=1 Tax=Vibrio phage phi 3 TaxID=1589298 RepID=A0A0B5H2T3_9CAUD|nr:phosphatase [Vibrio phage phi 3]AJF40797.1 hypothetical protein SBVP3_0029 [Vibrio phage phi 3]